jgi:hypothetical protein
VPWVAFYSLPPSPPAQSRRAGTKMKHHTSPHGQSAARVLAICLATWAVWTRNLAIPHVALGPVLLARLLPTHRGPSSPLRRRLAGAAALFSVHPRRRRHRCSTPSSPPLAPFRASHGEGHTERKFAPATSPRLLCICLHLSLPDAAGSRRPGPCS